MEQPVYYVFLFLNALFLFSAFFWGLRLGWRKFVQARESAQLRAVQPSSIPSPEAEFDAGRKAGESPASLEETARLARLLMLLVFVLAHYQKAKNRFRRALGLRPLLPPAPPEPPAPPPPPPEPEFTEPGREDEWRAVVDERDLSTRERVVDSLIGTLTQNDISVLVSRARSTGDESDLAREILYRLTYEDDPRFVGTEAHTKWSRLLSDEHSRQWVYPEPIPDDCDPVSDINGTFSLDRRLRVPIWSGGYLELGPGEVPCQICVSDPSRLQSGDDSDRVRFRVTVPAEDGSAYEWHSEIDMRHLFRVLESSAERDDRRAGDCLVRSLVIRDDDRSTMLLSAWCAGKACDLSIFRKHLYFRCDVVALRGGLNASGHRTPDRVGLRLYPHSYAAAGRKPTPVIQYAYRSIVELVRPSMPPSWGGVQPQPYFEQQPTWRKNDVEFLPGRRATVSPD